MKITKLADTIVLEDVKDFLLQHTFDCGQCFRWDAKETKFMRV